MKFNERLKQLRLANGLTQRELAKSIEVGRTTISEYESGKIVPKHDGLLKLANYFNVSVDYLTGVSDEPTTRKENASNLDAMLNTVHYVLLDEHATPVKYDGKLLSEKQKLIIAGLIDQLSDTIELLLQLDV